MTGVGVLVGKHIESSYMVGRLLEIMLSVVLKCVSYKYRGRGRRRAQHLKDNCHSRAGIAQALEQRASCLQHDHFMLEPRASPALARG